MERIELSAGAALVAGSLLLMSLDSKVARDPHWMISINVLLSEPVSSALVRDLDTQGQVVDVITELDAVVVKAPAWRLAAIRALPYVAAASPDAERRADTIHSFEDDLKSLVKADGGAMYLVVIGDGVPSDWRAHYPRERIATQHARAFDGGGGKTATVSDHPEKWQYDPNESREDIVSSLLLGSRESTGDRRLRPSVRGLAPDATVIPIRVSSGREPEVQSWSSRVTRALVYVTKLRRSGALGDAPVVVIVNMRGSASDVVEQAARDHAVASGVVIVTATGQPGRFLTNHSRDYPITSSR